MHCTWVDSANNYVTALVHAVQPMDIIMSDLKLTCLCTWVELQNTCMVSCRCALYAWSMLSEFDISWLTMIVVGCECEVMPLCAALLHEDVLHDLNHQVLHTIIQCNIIIISGIQWAKWSFFLSNWIIMQSNLESMEQHSIYIIMHYFTLHRIQKCSSK